MQPTAESEGLAVRGITHEADETVLLLGPDEPGFWHRFEASPEYEDGAPDPLDRFSKRLIGTLARAWGGRAVFPSDGPPWPPFTRWARESGRAHVSPVGLLVHDEVGLWLSFRGAIILPGHLPRAPAPANLCLSCTTQPCRSSCPVAALDPEGYDTASCKAFLRTPEGQDCMEKGCAVRRACPVSAGCGRLERQSAFHMRAFLRS